MLFRSFCFPSLLLFSVGADLAVDELEAALGIGDLLAQAGGEFGQQIAVFASGGFGVEVQLGEFAGEQGMPLGVEGGDVALGVLDLARDADELSGGAFAVDEGVWSQRMLADHAGIEQAHLARLETGQIEPGILILEKIADALEVDVTELFRG